MERHETGRPTARFPSAVPVLHGDSAVVLLRVLHNTDGFGVTGQYACRGGGSGYDIHFAPIDAKPGCIEQTAIVAHYPTINEARAAMQKGEIYGFYYIPKGTTAKGAISTTAYRIVLIPTIRCLSPVLCSTKT